MWSPSAQWRGPTRGFWSSSWPSSYRPWGRTRCFLRSCCGGSRCWALETGRPASDTEKGEGKAPAVISIFLLFFLSDIYIYIAIALYSRRGNQKKGDVAVPCSARFDCLKVFSLILKHIQRFWSLPSSSLKNPPLVPCSRWQRILLRTGEVRPPTAGQARAPGLCGIPSSSISVQLCRQHPTAAPWRGAYPWARCDDPGGDDGGGHEAERFKKVHQGQV